MVRPGILYIAGWGRSGSTLLAQILGETAGWLSCGEVRLIWDDFGCGCGEPVFNCALWGPVLREVLERHELDPAGARALRRSLSSSDPRTLRRIGRASPGSPAHRYAAVLADLYESVARAADATVLVDSSKTALDAYLARSLTGLDVTVIHLVRDPRAVAWSWQRRKPGSAPGRVLPTMGAARSSANWALRNAAIEAVLRPDVRLRYEDLVRDPGAAVSRFRPAVAGETGCPPGGRGRVFLHENHIVAGNPSRFVVGDVAIVPDDEWRTAMSPPSRLLATIPALPLVSRYGYRLRTSERSAR